MSRSAYFNQDKCRISKTNHANNTQKGLEYSAVLSREYAINLPRILPLCLMLGGVSLWQIASPYLALCNFGDCVSALQYNSVRIQRATLNAKPLFLFPHAFTVALLSFCTHPFISRHPFLSVKRREKSQLTAALSPVQGHPIPQGRSQQPLQAAELYGGFFIGAGKAAKVAFLRGTCSSPSLKPTLCVLAKISPAS